MIQQMGTLGNVFLIVMIIFGCIATLFVLGFVVAMWLHNIQKSYLPKGYTGNIFTKEKYRMQLDIDIQSSLTERVSIQIADIDPECEYIYLAMYLSVDETRELIEVLQRHIYPD